jgi:hypothetical protein
MFKTNEVYKRGKNVETLMLTVIKLFK